MVKLAITAAILPAAAWWRINPIFLRLQYLNRVRVRSIILVPTAKHGRPALFNSASAPANEPDFRIDGHASTPQSSLRRRRHFSAADTDLTCDRRACLERSTVYDTHVAYTVELTDISHWE